MATQFSEIVHNLNGFQTHLTEPKYYISVSRYASSNHMVYFSPHALLLQAWSYMPNNTVVQYIEIMKVKGILAPNYYHKTSLIFNF